MQIHFLELCKWEDWHVVCLDGKYEATAGRQLA